VRHLVGSGVFCTRCAQRRIRLSFSPEVEKESQDAARNNAMTEEENSDRYFDDLKDKERKIMDPFTEDHLRCWIAGHRHPDEDEELLFERIASIVADDPRCLEDGWARIADEARRMTRRE